MSSRNDPAHLKKRQTESDKHMEKKLSEIEGARPDLVETNKEPVGRELKKEENRVDTKEELSLEVKNRSKESTPEPKHSATETQQASPRESPKSKHQHKVGGKHQTVESGVTKADSKHHKVEKKGDNGPKSDNTKKIMQDKSDATPDQTMEKVKSSVDNSDKEMSDLGGY